MRISQVGKDALADLVPGLADLVPGSDLLTKRSERPGNRVWNRYLTGLYRYTFTTINRTIRPTYTSTQQKTTPNDLRPLGVAIQTFRQRKEYRK